MPKPEFSLNPDLKTEEMDSLRQEKVQKFEEFVDRRLKPDLVHAIAERSDLRKNIENLEKNSVTSLRTLVNLGSEVYMQAEVPDTQHIFVDVGLGFHVEFTWSEALKFISLRKEKLERSYLLIASSTKELLITYFFLTSQIELYINAMYNSVIANSIMLCKDILV
ncbi:hypothetical protein GOBAR_AA21468 [Gossypium barbadense]|uniref:Uncharacterized protein n=1 Tax=Gossypium barbadense TaxID=3634 RepID=A0A2P5X784_GOSBA|nr:hypothetical protein GOBAR_AA21468 [Gossypium barbadense]